MISGDCTLLFLQIISKLMCHFLRGTRVADHSVPSQIVLKFSSMMTELQDLLGKLGQALLHREHNCLLMVAFLQLCYNWGEMKVLLIHYSVKYESAADLQLAALQEDISATNLSYLHPYLNSELWNLVAQRIDNFGEADCKELLVKLILQKLQAVVLYVNNNKTRQDIMLSAARHLMSHIREAWPIILTGANALLVTSVLNPEQLECFANHVVQEIGCSSESCSEGLDALKKPGVQENRILVVAFTCAALRCIMKLFSGIKRKIDRASHQVVHLTLARKVLTRLDPCHILTCMSKDDLEALTPVVRDMASAVNGSFKKEEDSLVTDGWKLDVMGVQRYLHILELLPLQHTPGILKSLLVVSILALAITFERSDISRGEQLSNIRSLLYRHLLLGLLDSPGLPDLSSYLSIGQLANWLTNLDLPLSRDLQCLLFQRLFESSLSCSSTLHQLQDEMPVLQKQSSQWPQDMKTLGTAVALLQVLNKHENPEDQSLCLKYQRRLLRSIVRIMEHQDGAAASPSVFEGYNLMLIWCLQEGDSKQLEKLTPHLSTVVEACLSQIRSKDLPTQSSSIKSSLDLLATLLQYKFQFNAVLPSNFIHRVWSELANQDMSAGLSTVGGSEHMQLVFEAATEKELYPILQDLKVITKVAVQSSEKPEILRARLSIWKAVIQSRFSDGRINARKMALEQLCQMLTVFVNRCRVMHGTSGESSMLPVLELLLTITQKSLIFMSPEMLDLCFESVTTALAVDSPELLSLCSVSLQLLQVLMKFRESVVLDCIPSFLQCYRQLATTVASHGHVDLRYSAAEVKQYAVCAHGLERLTNLLKEHKPYFVRVAAYIVADLLQFFETYTLYPEVKIHYSNCIHSLLSICDSHAILFLSRTLTPASQLLLKTFYTTYNKFHRFTGKV
ncbi:hypothetical protein B7P43_G03174 [Cryptotermes secundus]|uniref:Nucleolar 27S pre-rRNA processing Urb2/Npa2 C-terminal domain-containing protein n=1 Tax=Cryptotermes secundus TaxID=105785 RepID=A0A2J7RG54_9NEOP|nr:hypothetical protein B7P43_G03174 [Cryptotermes secundus]